MRLYVVLFAFALPAFAQPAISGCQVFPANNIWNTPVDKLPVHASSKTWMTTIGANSPVHPDWGDSILTAGIPYNTVPGTQPRVKVAFEFRDESDPGPYPIPLAPNREGGPDPSNNSDRHVLVLDRDNCVLYEMFSAVPQPDGSWHAGSGAIFDLKANGLRPREWTSSDAAGLPVVPGLVRYEEIVAGEIKHAIRFTAPVTQKSYLWPARHQASTHADPKYPPMGVRFRLRGNFDISNFSPAGQVILRALKKYGMILADNGGAWFMSGVSDPGWDIETLVTELRRVHGSNLEAVDSTSLIVSQDSAQASPRDRSATPRPTPPKQ